MSSFNDTIDNVVYELATRPENIADKPFVSKTWSNPIFDTNTSSNYASNQVIFDTTILSNSGSPVSYSEGLIMLPMVIAVTKTGGATTDWTNNALSGTDFMVGLKNSHVQLIDRISITLNNTDIVQSVPMSNVYLSFIQHSEMSSEDEMLNMSLTGYAKDDSSSWYYNTPAVANGVLTGDSRGCGIGNNANFKLINAFDYNDVANEGLLKRQRLVGKLNAEKNAVLGNLNTTKEHQKNYIENLASGKYIYYDCVLRLKDLCPNLFKNFPLTQGVRLKITLTLNNNIEFQFRKNGAGNFVYDPASFINVSSATNPLMVASSYNPVVTQAGGNWQQTANDAGNANASGNFAFSLTDATTNTTLVPCGSSCLPCEDGAIYKVTMRIGEVNGNKHPRQQCMLYAPSVKLNPKHDLMYFGDSSRIRKIHYTDLEYQTFNVSSGSTFTKELSSSCVRPKRLIIVPFLSKTANFNLDPVSSPFTCEPATTSPCVLTNFNCSINNQNLYPNDIQYSYDHYLQNLNGQHGLSANQISGLVSSRINMVDFQNIYSYFVVDLSRRLPEQDLISSSIKIRGKVASPLSLEFHCFIEVEKIIELDCLTGALINRY